jgi:hypothetical protein
MRVFGGVVLGIAAWWAAFLLSTYLIITIWPTSEEFRQAVFDAGDLSVLPTAMLAAFLVMYLPIGLISGFVTAAVTSKRWHTWIVAAPIVAFAIFQHLFVLWDNLANWYNVAVVLVIAPCVFLGSKLWRGPEGVTISPAAHS